MPFSDIRGQERTISYLKSALKKGRLPHAFILAGPAGSGRRLLAKTVAKAVNCLNFQDGPCNNCISCNKIEKGVHPDISWIEKDPKSNQVKIHQIRAIESSIHLKPYEGRYKVFIVLDGECMNREAANSFLKTLEEPPGHSLIMILVSSAKDLLPTVRSRCQLVRLSPLSKNDLKRILIEEHNMSEVRADFISRISEGRLGKALSFEEGIEKWKNDCLDEFFKGESMDRYSKDDRLKLSRRLNVLASWYRDVLIYKTTKDEDLLINIDRVASIKEVSYTHSVDGIIKILEDVIKTKKMIEANVNPKLALSVMQDAL